MVPGRESLRRTAPRGPYAADVTLTVPGAGLRIHRAWWVTAVILGALVAAAGFRSSTGALLEPLESEFGWSRATTSGAVTANLVIYGLTAPFAAALMERFGLRRVVCLALVLVARRQRADHGDDRAWQLWLLWGCLRRRRCRCHGAGPRGDRRQPVVRRPDAGWSPESSRPPARPASSSSSRASRRSRPAPAGGMPRCVVTGAALLLVPLVLLVVRDRPADLGPPPLGALPGDVLDEPATRHTGSQVGPAALAVRTLRQSARSRTFWILFGTFWICGWSTNGLIGTHFIPAAHDHGMPQTTAAGLLALVGVFDLVGTIASGWLTDKVDPRLLLCGYYGFRGLALLFVPALLGPTSTPTCSSSSSSTAWTGWPRSRPRSPCAAGTSASRARVSSSAGSLPRTWWVPGSRPATPAGCGRAPATTSTAWVSRPRALPVRRAGLCLLIPRRGIGPVDEHELRALRRPGRCSDATTPLEEGDLLFDVRVVLADGVELGFERVLHLERLAVSAEVA